MSLYTPYFFFKDDTNRICHNCDGGVNFMATDDLDDRTKNLVLWAIEEGKRQKATEITRALGLLK